MNELLFWLAPASAVVGLIFAVVFFKQMKREDEGTDAMKKIGAYVREGAMAYLKQQYKVMLVVFLLVLVLFSILAYGFQVQNPWLPVTFAFGGFFSALAGYFGMQTATQASTRTAAAARESLGHSLRIAFRSGAVMGLTVVGLGLLNVCFWYLVLNAMVRGGGDESHRMILVTTTMLTFGMGASL